MIARVAPATIAPRADTRSGWSKAKPIPKAVATIAVTAAED
jgi:hypothetical protein